MSGCYLQDLVVQLLDSVSSSTVPSHASCICALACVPAAHGCMPTGLKCVANLQTYMHGMTFGGGVYFMLHARCSVVRSALNWHVWQHGGVDDATSTMQDVHFAHICFES